jgi:hypothetical protein
MQNLPTVVRQHGLDLVYQKFVMAINLSLKETIPVKQVSPHSRSWWDAELQHRPVEIRSKAHRDIKNYVQNRDGLELLTGPAYANLWDKYVQLRRKVHTLAAAKKKSFYQSLLSKLETDFVSDRSSTFIGRL